VTKVKHKQTEHHRISPDTQQIHLANTIKVLTNTLTDGSS